MHTLWHAHPKNIYSQFNDNSIYNFISYPCHQCGLEMEGSQKVDIGETEEQISNKEEYTYYILQ